MTNTNNFTISPIYTIENNIQQPVFIFLQVPPYRV